MFSYSIRFLDLGVYYLILGEIICLHITFTRTVLVQTFARANVSSSFPNEFQGKRTSCNVVRSSIWLISSSSTVLKLLSKASALLGER